MTVFPRVIPVLLVSDGYLVKPTRFKGEGYVGDPINAVRIFNEKQVDELLILDIDATVRRTGVNYKLIEEIANEAFMPVGYGGGVTSATEARRVTGIGIEKVILGTVAARQPDTISEVAGALGSSSTVVSVDARKRPMGGWDTFIERGRRKTRLGPAVAARQAQDLGAGEVIVSSIDRESSFTGYDLALIEAVADAVTVPVVALGGARSVDDFVPALAAGASAVAAGSLFVLNGRHRAVLISYPTPQQVRALSVS